MRKWQWWVFLYRDGTTFVCWDGCLDDIKERSASPNVLSFWVQEADSGYGALSMVMLKLYDQTKQPCQRPHND